jgi:hypothetical protein
MKPPLWLAKQFISLFPYPFQDYKYIVSFLKTVFLNAENPVRGLSELLWQHNEEDLFAENVFRDFVYCCYSSCKSFFYW